MFTTSHRRLAVGAAAALVAASPLFIPAASEAAAPLTCRANMSDATPQQYTDTYVHVVTAPGARIRTDAHYKTTTTSYIANSGRTGKVYIDYYISGATPGYRVHVDVTVRKNGHIGHCSTSFLPHR